MDQSDEARQILRQLLEFQGHGREVSLYIALVNHGLGDDEETLKWLEQAAENHLALDELNTLPLWKDLRPHSRVQAILRKMHLVK